MRTKDQALTLYRREVARKASRNETYRKLRRYYEGEFRQENPLLGTPDQSLEEAEEGIRLVANLLKSTVDHYTALGAFPPDIRVPPKGPEENQQKFAARLEEIIYALWDDQEMPVKLVATWHNLSKLGTSGFLLMPDYTRKTIQVLTAFPDYCYAKIGRDGTDYEYFIYAYLEDKETGLTIPPDLAEFYPDAREMMLYWDRERFYRFEGTEFLGGIEHGYGFVPAELIPNVLVPERVEGQSDIEQVVGLNQYLNELFSWEADVIAFAANPYVIIESDEVGPEDIPPGGGIIPVRKGDRVYLLEFQGSMPMVENQAARTQQYIHDLTGISEVSYGRVKQSVASGSAISKMIQPTVQAVAARQVVVGSRLQRLNRKWLAMIEKHFPDEEFFLATQKGGNLISVNFRPRTHIKGYYQNRLIWPSSIMNEQQRKMLTLQAKGAGLISAATARREWGVVDPVREAQIIEQEQLREAKLQVQIKQMVEAAVAQATATQAQAQAPQQGAQAPIPTPMPPRSEGSRLSPAEEERRFLAAMQGEMPGQTLPPSPVAEEETPGTRSTPLLGGQGATAPGAGETVGNRISLQQAIQALSQVQPLRGRVWLVGEIVREGFTDGAVELAITDGLDKRTILDRAPSLYGRVKFKKVSGEPREQAYPVI